MKNPKTAAPAIEEVRRRLAEACGLYFTPMLGYTNPDDEDYICRPGYWLPDHNWEQMGMVVEAMRLRGYGFQCEHESGKEEKAWADFDRQYSGEYFFRDARAATLPLAVCRAAYAALVAEKEPKP